MQCIVWMADAGAEVMLLVSINSLRRNARAFWGSAVKLVLDFGLTSPVAAFLGTLVTEHLYCAPVPLPPPHSVAGGDPHGGIGVMRRRVEVMTLAPAVCSSVGVQPSGYIVCDADTVFLRPLDDFVFPSHTDQITIMREWDLRNGREEPMLMCRRSSFTEPYPLDVAIARAAAHLDIDEQDLRAIPTFNTGVVGFAAGTDLSGVWSECYDDLRSVLHDDGAPVFSPYAIEQNAMSICLSRNIIRHNPLDRSFNQFPPRAPHGWPAETAIAHFISFRNSCSEARYALWFESARVAMQDEWLPEPLRRRVASNLR